MGHECPPRLWLKPEVSEPEPSKIDGETKEPSSEPTEESLVNQVEYNKKSGRYEFKKPKKKRRKSRFTKKEDREATHIKRTEKKMHPTYSKKRLNKIAYGHIQKQKKGKKGKR